MFRFLPTPRTSGGHQAETRSRTLKPARSSWRAILRCRLRRKAVDRELAAGADPNSSACRRHRASELTDEGNREALAVSYEHLLVGMTHTLPIGLAHVNWSAVRVATPLLDDLAERLRRDPAVRAQGVARAQLLLADRDSALYGRSDESRLVAEVRSTLALL